MTELASIILAGGGAVVLEATAQEPGHPADLQARLFDPTGTLARTVLVDAGFFSDGRTAPPGQESFANARLIGLTGGGFAIAYDNVFQNDVRSRDTLKLAVFDETGARLGDFERDALSFSGGRTSAYAYPELAPLANGGLALVSTNTDAPAGSRTNIDFFNERFEHLGQLSVERPAGLADTYPPSLADSSQGVILTFTGAAGEMRGLVREDGAFLIAPTTVRQFMGGAGNDRPDHSSGPDLLTGGDGNDSLFGGPGYDVLSGGSGADTFVFSPDSSVDQAIDFTPDLDRLLLVLDDGTTAGGPGSTLILDDRTHILSWDADGDSGGRGPAPVAIARTLDDLWPNLLAEGFQPAVLRVIRPDGTRLDRAFGSADDDTLRGGDGADYMRGGAGADVIAGGRGFDDLNGNPGADTIDGGEGPDWVRGGKGDDSVAGGAGDDWLSGDLGSDTLSGGAGADVFHSFGGAGLDRVTDFNRAEGDRVQLDAGTAYVVSQVGADVVIDMAGGGQMVLVGVSMASLTDGWIIAT